MTERERILAEVMRLGVAEDPSALLDPGQGGQDMHAIVHVLFMLRREGLVTFRERRVRTPGRPTSSGVNGGKVPTRIVLTRRGRAELGC